MQALQKNYFELLGQPVLFALDLESLDAAFLALQRAVHPDRFAGGSDTQRRLALQLTSQVNRAYQVLRASASRAAYLCELAGVDVELESNTSMPSDFLMLQMEWREALDEIPLRSTTPVPTGGVRVVPGELVKLRAAAQSKAEELHLRLGSLIDERRDYATAASATRQLVFIEKFLEDLSHRG